MSETLTIQYDDLLELLESLEHGMHDYYQGLANRAKQTDLKRLWVKMAEQEETHTRLVRLMRKRSADDDDLRQIEMDVSASSISTIEDFLSDYPRIIRNPDLTLEKSFRVALTLESLELTPIYKRFIEKQDKPTQDVLQELLESEDIHLNVLVKNVKRYIDNPDFQKYAEEVLADKVQSGIE